MVKTALVGVFGDLAGAFIKALWPPGFEKEKRMMELIMTWTKDYVDAQFARDLRERVKALLDTSTKDIMEEYQKCISRNCLVFSQGRLARVPWKAGQCKACSHICPKLCGW